MHLPFPMCESTFYFIFPSLIREIHFMKHLPHPNIAPIITMYLNREARADLSKLKCFYIVMPLYEPGSIYAVTK